MFLIYIFGSWFVVSLATLIFYKLFKKNFISFFEKEDEAKQMLLKGLLAPVTCVNWFINNKIDFIESLYSDNNND